jgi:NADH-quinone oxidoreductase subunit C
MSQDLETLGLDIVARAPGLLGHSVAFGELTIVAKTATVVERSDLPA